MAETERERAMRGLRAASDAGDDQAATQFAEKIRDLDAQTPAQPTAPGPAQPRPGAAAAPAPAPVPAPGEEPSGFVPSAQAGLYGAVEAGTQFVLEAGKSRMRKEVTEAVSRERQGLPVHPNWSPDAIRKRYHRALGDQEAVDQFYNELMTDLDYKEAEWKSGQYWARVKQVVGSAVGSTVPMAVSGPLAPFTTYAMAGGQVLNELKDIEGLSDDAKLKIAVAAGVPVAVMERIGLKGMIGKGLIKGAAGEALTETLTELGVISIGAASGREYEAMEILARGGEAALGGAGTGPVIKGVKTAITVPTKMAKQAVSSKVQEWKYGGDSEQLLSDERVADAYQEKLDSMDKSQTNKSAHAFNVFKTIGKDMQQVVKDSIEVLQNTGVTTKEQAKEMGVILKKAGMQSQVMDEADFKAIANLPVEQGTKDAIGRAMRDLNTTVELGMDKATKGPAQEWMRKYGAVAGVLAGAKVGKPGLGLVLGQSAEYFGRGLDTISGTRKPRVLKGRSGRQALIRKHDLAQADPFKVLKSLQADAAAGIPLADAERQLAIEEGRRLRARRRYRNNPGRMHFDRYIFSGKPQSGVPGTGLLPAEVDKGLIELLMRKDITIDQHRQFYEAPNMLMVGDQGNKIVDLLDGLADEGLLTREPNADPATLAGSGIVNPTAYNANVRNAEVARDNAFAAIQAAGLPQEATQLLTGVATEMIATKNKSEKLAVMTSALQGLPAPLAKEARAILDPLTKFGSLSPETATKVEKAVKE